MTGSWQCNHVSEAGVRRLADLVAYALRAGDVVTLVGDLGAGKTTFARAVIRAAFADDAVEVPSPTFSLVQTYGAPRTPVSHFDLYRLASAAEAREVGLDEAAADGAVLIEWPDRVARWLPPDRLEIVFGATADPDTRDITLTGHGSWAPRVDRLHAIGAFLERSGWAAARLVHLQGDASTRRYARLRDGDRRVILMDAPRQPDGPPVRNGKPYSRIAHLAEDVRPFVAVTGALRDRGLSAPELFAADLSAGLLLIEDLGDGVYGRELQSGASQSELWRAAIDALVALRRHPVPRALPVTGAPAHVLPAYDRDALRIETELLLDWYWPLIENAPAPPAARAAFAAAWEPVFDRLLSLPSGWVLRDYHSPNLLWLPGRVGVRRVGVIDVQDAVQGHPAYDVVSLLQDARLDVPASLEARLRDHYGREVAAHDAAFDEDEFAFAYAALGAQRNTKILGIFARLAQRDNKPQYLQHLPRIRGYLARNLSEPALYPLRAWYATHLRIETENDARPRAASPVEQA
jgi:hypothetical protein